MNLPRRLWRIVAPLVLVTVAVYVVVDVAVNVDESRPAAVAAATAMAAGVLLLRRAAFYGALIVFVSACVLATVSPEEVENDTGAVFVAVIFTGWWAGRFAGRRLAPAALVVLLVCSTYVNVLFDATPSDYFWVAFFMAGAWVAGFVIAERTARADRMVVHARRLELEQERLAREAVREERQRIARELHDVIAHSVSEMTVQAGAVRRLLRPDQEQERLALATVEQTGRDALTEMRRLVGLLREQGTTAELEPQPSLGALDSLLGSVRDAGLPVELSVDGEPRELPPGVDLAAYRIVQEALTSALGRPGPAHAWVALRWRPRELELEIANDGDGGASAEDGANGLVRMRERVTLYGGDLVSAERPGGGIVVRARLPLEVST